MNPVSANGFQLQLLGDFRVELNGQPVTGACYNKMRALLAYLVMERQREHRREALADLLWGGLNPTTARGNLRRTLADLRRVLEQPLGMNLFAASKHSLRYVGGIHVDVVAFTEQTPAASESDAPSIKHDERVLALYRGEFLAGLSMPDCSEFEQWLLVQRENLHRRALAALERLINQYEANGQYQRALDSALRYAELEPWDEDVCRRAMLLYTLNGQDKAALNHYEAACRGLKKELGVLPSEETRQLAQRIRVAANQREQAHSEQLPRAQGLGHAPAQRRQVTALYCDVFLTRAMDPEDAMATLSLPMGRCVTTIERHGGHVVQTHGGGVLAYFGYPMAHEGAARRAVQAAIEVSQPLDPGMRMRAGIHTGLVIAGGAASIPDTSGRTTQIAMQLCHGSDPQQIVISQDTHRIAGWFFDCINLGEQTLPGLEHTLEIFEVRAESGARNRLEASEKLTPLIGRTAELSQLLAYWHAAGEGRRQVVMLRGDAGMGKSRMVLALRDRLAATSHLTLELRCFPEFSQSPFHPLIVTLGTAIGIVAGDPPEQNLARLVDWMERCYAHGAKDGIPLLAQLLSLPQYSPSPGNSVSAQKQKDQTIALVLAVLQEQARRKPVLVILEDLHWVDPSTLDLLNQFILRSEHGPILAILTARPEFVPPWTGEQLSQVDLGPLSEDQIMNLVTSLRSDMEPATVQRIVEHVDGVPLFAEEMTKMASDDSRTPIPTTLQDLLAASIDALGPAKTVAQLAATLGRQFELEVLNYVLDGESAALEQALSALLDAQVLTLCGESSFQFKHYLIQQAAYESQPLSVRKMAHQRIAKALMNGFPALGVTQPESLARHLAAGGEALQAIHYWNLAAQRAVRRCAYVESMAHCDAGLGLLAMQPTSPERDHLECALRMNLGATLIATRGYGSVEAEAQYTRAADLASTRSHGPDLFPALWGLWLGSSSRVGHAHSLELAKKLLQLSEQNDDALLLQKAHYAMGNSLLWTGQLDLARHHQERAMALYRPEHHDALVGELGENIRVSTGSQLAWVLWLQGFPDQARAMGEQTLALAHELNHPYSRCYASAHLISLHRWLRQLDITHYWAQETVSQAQRHGFPLWLLSGQAFVGWVRTMRGDATGLGPLRSGIDAVRAAMGGIEAYFLAPLAELQHHLGQHEEAHALAQQTLSVMQARQDHFLESEMLRLLGQCELTQREPDVVEAEAHFQRALAVSRRQGAKSLELRAAISLARLWQSQNQTDQAWHLLHGLYSWFTEGLDTADLADAKQLLAELKQAASTKPSVGAGPRTGRRHLPRTRSGSPPRRASGC